MSTELASQEKLQTEGMRVCIKKKKKKTFPPTQTVFYHIKQQQENIILFVSLTTSLYVQIYCDTVVEIHCKILQSLWSCINPGLTFGTKLKVLIQFSFYYYYFRADIQEPRTKFIIQSTLSLKAREMLYSAHIVSPSTALPREAGAMTVVFFYMRKQQREGKQLAYNQTAI